MITIIILVIILISIFNLQTTIILTIMITSKIINHKNKETNKHKKHKNTTHGSLFSPNATDSSLDCRISPLILGLVLQLLWVMGGVCGVGGVGEGKPLGGVGRSCLTRYTETSSSTG